MKLRAQKGAIGLSAAVLLLSVIMLAAMVIDTARLFFAQRELQTQADLAALAMTRGACYLDGVNGQAAQEAQALANLGFNGFDLEQDTVSFLYGTAGIENSHWKLNTAGEDYQPAAGVNLTNTLPASLLAGGLWGEQVQLSASAVVYKRMAAGFGIGSGLLDVDLTNSLLGALLGGSVNVLRYDGLASTRLSLGSLLLAMDDNGLLSTDLAVGTVDEVLDSNVALADLVEASIDALNAQGTADVDVISALTELENVARVGSLGLTLSDLLTLATATDEGMGEEMQRAALATDINLYGLVSGAVMASNRNHFVEIPGLDVDLGIAGLSVGLTIIEPPQYVFGLLPAERDGSWVAAAKTAQVELDLSATLLGGGLDLGLIQVDTGSIGIHVDVALAETRLLDAGGCSLSDPEVRLDFATRPSVANLTIGDGDNPDEPISLGAEVGVTVLLVPLTVPVAVNISAEVPVASNDWIEHRVVLQQQELPYTEENISAGPGDTFEDTLDNTELSVTLDVLGSELLGGLVNGILESLTTGLLPLVDTLIDNLVRNLVEPLLEALGITVGYADIIVESVDLGEGNLIE